MKFTILGASGIIGSALFKELKERKCEVYAPTRAELGGGLEGISGRDLGHVIYCIGLTADFREFPLETVEAHVVLLTRLIRYGMFDSITYLSSTRIYSGASSTCEGSDIKCSSLSLDSLYNISKLMGESTCLQCAGRGRVVRLSNVYSSSDINSKNFLTSVLRDAATKNIVQFNLSPQSAKDYISISDVISLLPDIAVRGEFGIYNLASGTNVTNQQIFDALTSLGVVCGFSADAETFTFPEIDNRKLAREFGAPRGDLLSDIPAIFIFLKKTLCYE